MAESGFSFGKWLMIGGAALLAVGALVFVLERAGIHLGRLPGDIHVRGERGSFHFPIVTSIVVSVVATLLLNWFLRR